MKNLQPIFLDINIDEFDHTGIEFISLVDRPAIQSGWVAMSQGEDKPNTIFVKLSVMDNDKMVLIGKVLIPDMPIFRGYDQESGAPVFLRFSAEMILKLEQKFARNNFNNNINEMHTEKMCSAFVFENWIVENPAMDKAALYLNDIQKGEMIAMVQVTDKKYWDEYIKTGKLNGFSIQGFLNHSQNKSEEELQSKMAKLNQILEKIDLKLLPTIYNNN